MKMTIAILFSVLASTAFANDFDSMAIFHNPNQVIVLINEKGGEKLGPIMDAYTSGNELNLSSTTGNLSLTCKRAGGAHSCTFKFKKSGETEIHDTWMFTHSESDETQAFRIDDFVHTGFKNQKGETFGLAIDSFQIIAETHK